MCTNETEKDCAVAEEELATEEVAEAEAAEETTEEAAPEAPAVPVIPAAERIAKLFDEMPRQKAMLVAVIDGCREELTAAQIDELLAPLQEYNHSVYTPSTIRRLLERAGALEYLAHDDELVEGEVDENGEPVEAVKPDPTWLSTAEGLEFIEDQDPMSELMGVLEPLKERIETFRFILELCNGEGASTPTIDSELRKSGLMAGDKMQSGFYMAKLEDYQAIEWRGVWKTTELGLQYLELLAQEEQQG